MKTKKQIDKEFDKKFDEIFDLKFDEYITDFINQEPKIYKKIMKNPKNRTRVPKVILEEYLEDWAGFLFIKALENEGALNSLEELYK